MTVNKDRQHPKDRIHIPVLCHEATQALAINPCGLYVDGTFGRGGHSAAILKALGPEGRLWAFDQDPEAIAYGQQRFAKEPRLTLVHDSFARLEQWVQAHDSVGQVQGLLLDLGVSSAQLDVAERGFSFQKDGPLDMRMDLHAKQTAATWLNQANLRELVRVFKSYGEVPHAVTIAKRIIEARQRQPIVSTHKLAQICCAVKRPVFGRKHPATQIFQAIRIHINDELNSLAKILGSVDRWLAPAGRCVVISFHSLEDALVKRILRPMITGRRLPKQVAVFDNEPPSMRWVGRSAIRPSAAECQHNPRARSAMMRVAERLA